jgi:hypothetical protein
MRRTTHSTVSFARSRAEHPAAHTQLAPPLFPSRPNATYAWAGKCGFFNGARGEPGRARGRGDGHGHTNHRPAVASRRDDEPGKPGRAEPPRLARANRRVADMAPGHTPPGEAGRKPLGADKGPAGRWKHSRPNPPEQNWRSLVPNRLPPDQTEFSFSYVGVRRAEPWDLHFGGIERIRGIIP